MQFGDPATTVRTLLARAVGRKTSKGLTIIFANGGKCRKKIISIRKGSLRGFPAQMFGTERSPVTTGGWRRETPVSMNS